MVEVCDGTIDYKQFRLECNKWGNPSATVCVNDNNNAVGWRWSNNGGWTYPDIYVGTNFCNRPSTWSVFPIKWGDVTSWKIDLAWEYIENPTGEYNLAFDIYFSDVCNVPSGISDSSKKMNPMIWLQAGGDLAYGVSGLPLVSDGYNQYYSEDIPQPWPRKIFHLKDYINGNGSATIDVKKLCDTISGLSSNWILTDIFLGNENTGGNGTGSGNIKITKYDIEINGQIISLDGTGGSGGGSGVSWFDRTTCITPTLCIPNKYMAIGVGGLFLMMMTMMKK